jgi:hypothetical protein
MFGCGRRWRRLGRLHGPGKRSWNVEEPRRFDMRLTTVGEMHRTTHKSEGEVRKVREVKTETKGHQGNHAA